MATTKAERLYFTGNDEADELLARDPVALLIGFILDQQVPLERAFAAPLELKRRFGTLEPEAIAGAETAELERIFSERPALHRFPGTMARRTQELCAAMGSDNPPPVLDVRQRPEWDAGRTPHLTRLLPRGWEERHSPGSFTYAAHQAFFAGFLPTPARPVNDEILRNLGQAFQILLTAGIPYSNKAPVIDFGRLHGVELLSVHRVLKQANLVKTQLPGPP